MSTKNNPTHRRAVTATPLVLTKKVFTQEDLEEVKRTQALLPWLALEMFKINKATSADWMMLQFWLYYTEALVSVFITKDAQDRLNMGLDVSEGIAALYAIGRRFNDSGYKTMTATQHEINEICVGLMHNDALKEITEEKMLVAIGKRIQKILKIN